MARLGRPPKNPKPENAPEVVGEVRKPVVGKPKNIIREFARMKYEERIPILCAIIDSERASNRDKISAFGELGKVSGLYQMDVVSDGERLEPTQVIVRMVELPMGEIIK
jgi:hypothetical protein